MPALVGLDVGTTGVKALAISESGEVLAVAGRSTLYPPGHEGRKHAGARRVRPARPGSW